MILVKVQGHGGNRALCEYSRTAIYDKPRFLCGLCGDQQVRPWLGFVCPQCGAIVVSVETDDAQEAAGIEAWMYNHMELLVKLKLSADEMESEGRAPDKPREACRAVQVREHLREIVAKFNAKRGAA